MVLYSINKSRVELGFFFPSLTPYRMTINVELGFKSSFAAFERKLQPELKPLSIFGCICLEILYESSTKKNYIYLKSTHRDLPDGLVVFGQKKL
jgi:hypothetical protein